MPASEPPQPKNNILLIRAFELPDASSTTGCRGSDQTSDSDQSATDNKWRDSIIERISKIARFGPIYGEDTEDQTKKVKDDAWERFVKEEGGGDINRNINKIISYKRFIKNIDKQQVLKCYDTCRPRNTLIPPCHDFLNSNSSEEKLKREFWNMMVRDGCFFLQLALHILGGGDLLGYPEQNPYFGKNIDSTIWIPGMFFVGNQIPYTLLKALMERRFFNGVIEKGVENNTWQRPVNDPVKLALYQTVVEPHLKTKKKKKEFNKLLMRMIGKKQQPITNSATEPSSNVLQTLHNLLSGTGSGNGPTYTEMKEFHDLEANNDGKDMKIPSAGELYKKGIKLVKGKPGISNIRFRNWGYRAFLEVPPFTIDDQTLQVLTSLANYELDLNESERELTSYLRFMRDLARTYKDFKILEKRGIILVEGKESKGKMVCKLDDIVSHHNSNFTLNFCQIRRMINDYGGPPWRFISFCLGIFTVVQTIFTVLSYCIPPRTKP